MFYVRNWGTYCHQLCQISFNLSLTHFRAALETSSSVVRVTDRPAHACKLFSIYKVISAPLMNKRIWMVTFKLVFSSIPKE